MIERRETSRRRVCFGGLIRVASFLPEIACLLRDVSLDGVRIRLPAETPLPARFDLVVPCRGETRRVRVVWRDGDLAGVGFENALPEAAPGETTAAEILRRLGESEAEVTRLRAELIRTGDGAPVRVH